MTTDMFIVAFVMTVVMTIIGVRICWLLNRIAAATMGQLAILIAEFPDSAGRWDLYIDPSEILDTPEKL